MTAAAILGPVGDAGSRWSSRRGETGLFPGRLVKLAPFNRVRAGTRVDTVGEEGQ
jgi:hypothetical protein